MIEQIRMQWMLACWWWQSRRHEVGIRLAKMLPHNVAYWVLIQAVSHAARLNPSSEVPALTAKDLLDAWGFHE